MKFKNITNAAITLRGVTFEPKKAVDVTDEGLAAKISAMPQFASVSEGPKKNADES